ncbi:unnamed protein product [Mytilus edulis]|uniref:G-protein coupled receptors family 2 profile 1 domain-containing protein n=1 Tax=Mytilus edulis TaxID=6550 RepID=A0A8S3V4S3_MYTED|nr:unnamed protein product [Mytilus edulis]
MTTESTLESVKTPISSSTYFTESTKFERTAPTRTTPLDASCVLPEDLKNAVWEYNYTDVASNSEQSTTLNIGTTTLQDSVINLNVFGTTIRDWTCINSLNISNAQTLVVFNIVVPSAFQYLYEPKAILEVKKVFKKTVMNNNIETSVFPNERVFMSEAGNAPSDEAPMCSTFCQYTDSLKIRTLRRPELDITTIMTTESTLESVTTPTSSFTYFTESTAPTGTTPLDSIHHCADNLDRFDTKWNRTVENTLVTVTCTGEYTGTVSRNCSSGGMWNEPDYTQCIIDKLLAEDSEFPLVSTILGNLENVTSANDELRTGDLVTASALLEDIAKYVTNHTDKISVDQLENFGSICNDLLDKKYHQSWEEQKDKGTSGITTVVKAVTDYNSVFHNVLDGEFSMLVNKENIDLTGYSCTFYRNISSLFPKQILLNREVQPFDGIYDVNSIIADVSIEAESCSDYSLDLRFGHVLVSWIYY